MIEPDGFDGTLRERSVMEKTTVLRRVETGRKQNKERET